MAKTSLTLPERFDITGIEALKARFEKTLEKDADTIEVNAQGVTHMDSSGAQLLLSFQRAAEARQKTIKVVKISDDFMGAAELLGIQRFIET
jgi:anti-anti-sigma regulatory factor